MVLSKCEVLLLGGAARSMHRSHHPQEAVPPDYLDMGFGLVTIVTSLRFLGVGIDHSGCFISWRSSSDILGSVAGVLSRLSCLGFVTYPSTMAVAL